MNRYELVQLILPRQKNGGATLLDVGCRDCVLKRYLPPGISYAGLDIAQNAGRDVDFLHSLERPLPFEDRSYDFVVALDCLEHVDDLHGALDELIRVARRSVLVSLPNMAYVKQRINFFLHGRLSTGKYTLRYGHNQRGGDRHRWLTVAPQTDTFMKMLAADNHISLGVHRILESRKRTLFSFICRSIGAGPSWWAPATLYVLSKTDRPANA